MARQALLRHFVLVLLMIKSNIKYSDAKQCDNTNIINILIANITANMDKAVLFDPERADLNSIASLKSSKPFCLIPKKEFYVQVDFDKPVTITGLKLKGHAIGGSDRSYHRFTLQFSFDEKTWLEYNANEQKDKNQKYFLMSNHETGTIFDCPLEKHAYARYMRIILTPPLDKIEKLCLRFDVRGCHVVPLPRIETPPIVEGIIGQEEKLKCVGEGMVGMTIGWKNYTTTTKTSSDQSSQYLMVTNESTLPVTIVLEDLASLYCQRFPTYLVCLQNYTCTGSYSFNGNATVEVSTVLEVKVYFPSQPNKFIVKEKRRGEVSLTWDSPALNNLTEDMLEFVLSCNTTGNFTTEILPMSVQSKLLTGLEVYHPYQCSLKVQMNTDSRNRVPFEFVQNPVVLNFKSLSVAPKVKPVLTAEVLSPTKIGTNFQVQFNRPEYGVISGFYLVATMFSYSSVKELSRSNIPMSEQVIKNWINDSSVRSYTITGVKPWSNYSVSIQAFNEDNLFTDITSLTVLTPEGVPSRGPKVEDQFLGTDSFIFKVNLDESFKNGEIIQYTVKIEPGNLTRNYPVSTPKPVVDTIRKLKPFQRYSFSCKAKTRLGFGPYGEVHVIITPEGIPSMPQNVHVVHVLDTNDLILRWSKPKYPNGNISKYEVRIMLNNGTEFSSYATPDAIELFTVNVSKHDVAQVKVRAQTGLGWGRMSIPIYPGAKAEEKTDNESLNEVVLIVAFIAAVFFLLVLVVLCFLHHRRQGNPFPMKDPTTEPIFPRASTTSGPDNDDEYTMELSTWTAKRRISGSVGTGSQSIINNTRDPIPVGEFSDYMDEAKNADYEIFLEQFESITSGKCSPWQTAELPENKPKNRYTNVAAYDSSRVILKVDSKRKASDYINASTVNGYNHEEKGPHKYISTQGPLDNTQDDFWHMIWQEEITIIVMLTNLQENDKLKCSQYWPHERRTVYGDVCVTLDKIDKTADYVTRTFQVELTATKEVRTVLQFHFVSWPDHGVPDYPTAILSLRRRVRHHYDESKPMLVHCSAGIGRSGCFILIDAMLERIDKEKSVDVFNYLKYMRTRRINMVQTFQQYRFAHLAILEYVTFGNTEIFVGELDKKIRQLGKNNGFENEFSLLTSNTAEQAGNMYQVLLREGRFIDAYHVDGYKQRDAFILTKASTESNVGDFWKMVLEKQCHTIVMLNKCQETSQSYFKYWPNVDNHCVYGDTTVLTVSEVANGNIITRKIKVTTNKRRCEVHHFQYVDWPDSDVPHRRGYSNICTLMQAVEKSQQNLGNGPIIVHEGNGYGRSGSFIAIYNSTERLKVEQLIDVLQCVRAIRIAQPLAVDNITQYQFVYNMLRTYLEGFENYWNYKDYKVTRSPLGSTSTN